MIGNRAKLTLVGAGPGDPELFTLKGIKVLSDADVVLYDALIDISLLDYAAKAEKIYVGKRAGSHHASQEQINNWIIEYALQNKHVVRLKGGDPFIFGRGQEELEAAIAHNIAIDVVPGISSAIGIPTLHHIPLTSRGSNESIWITTGTTSECKLSKDIAIAAQSNATVVVLMGMSQLHNIVEIFKQHKPKNYPIAIIQNGSFEHEKKVIGDIDTIVELAKQAQIKTPAIIIIGEVVNKMPK
jgi:uroporphyrin-III C-methyltransferase